MNTVENDSAGRVILIVLDGCGVGAMPDAADYGDEAADTLKHTLEVARTELPWLAALGLGWVKTAPGLPPLRGHAGLLASWRSGPKAKTPPRAIGS